MTPSWRHLQTTNTQLILKTKPNFPILKRNKVQLKSTNQSFTFPNLKTNVPLYRQDKSTTIGPVNGKKQKNKKTITCILKTAQITAQGKKIIHIYNHIIDHIPMKKLRNQKQNKQTGPIGGEQSRHNCWSRAQRVS